jgi:hypothetical protein
MRSSSESFAQDLIRPARTTNGESGGPLLELDASAYRLSTATLLLGRGLASLASIFSGVGPLFQTLDTAKNEKATHATVKAVEGEKKECWASMLRAGFRPLTAACASWDNCTPGCCDSRDTDKERRCYEWYGNTGNAC